MDGSLGIMYPHPGFEEFSIASRGSFTSPQALFGTDLLNNKYRKWTKHFRYEPENFPENSIFLAEKTVIFEIIYPENRIVVNYGDMEDMVYLGVVENSTGNDLYPVIEKDWPFPVVRRYTELENLTMDELVERVNNHEDYGNNREGYVVKFKNGSRTKLKYPDYIRLHRIMTDMSEKRILEAVIQGPLSEEFLDGVPDECYDWLKDVEKRFRAEYETIKLSCQLFYQQCQLKQIGDAPKFTRKDWALAFLKTPYPAVLFNMLDGNDYSPAIWAKIEPKPGKQTFQTSGYNRTKEKT
jgi:RNA ligase